MKTTDKKRVFPTGLRDMENPRKQSLGKPSVFGHAPYSTDQRKKTGSVSTTKSKQQLHLDFGQKNKGYKVCADCNMHYQHINNEDRILHDRYHAVALSGLGYSWHKDEVVVMELTPPRLRLCSSPQVNNLISAYLSTSVELSKAIINENNNPEGVILDKIIVIAEISTASTKREAMKVVEHVNSELNAVNLEPTSIQNSKIYLYVTRYTSPPITHKENKPCISKKTSKQEKLAQAIIHKKPKIIGCLIAESLTTAYRLSPSAASITNEYDATTRSTEPVPVLAGVSRLWVSKDERRRGIGSILLNAMRYNFMTAQHLLFTEIAFSQPTQDGFRLFSRLCERNDVLVY